MKRLPRSAFPHRFSTYPPHESIRPRTSVGLGFGSVRRAKMHSLSKANRGSSSRARTWENRICSCRRWNIASVAMMKCYTAGRSEMGFPRPAMGNTHLGDWRHVYSRRCSYRDALRLFLVPHSLSNHGINARADELDELELWGLFPALQACGGAVDHVRFEVFLLHIHPTRSVLYLYRVGLIISYV